MTRTAISPRLAMRIFLNMSDDLTSVLHRKSRAAVSTNRGRRARK